jgi:hypothetical protein
MFTQPYMTRLTIFCDNENCRERPNSGNAEHHRLVKTDFVGNRFDEYWYECPRCHNRQCFTPTHKGLSTVGYRATKTVGAWAEVIRAYLLIVGAIFLFTLILVFTGAIAELMHVMAVFYSKWPPSPEIMHKAVVELPTEVQKIFSMADMAWKATVVLLLAPFFVVPIMRQLIPSLTKTKSRT